MSHDPHIGSVIAAYVLAVVVVGGMIGAVVVDYMRLKRALSLLAMPERHQQPQVEQPRTKATSARSRRFGMK
jgi:hypothetical protein